MAKPVADWIKIQSKTFVKWCNVQIEKAGHEPVVKDLFEDLKEGTNLVRVLEGCTGNQFPYKMKTSKLKIQQIETLNNAFQFMSENGVKLVNIGATDVHDGRPKLILGMIWSLIANFSIVSKLGGEGSAKDLLLEWVNSHLEDCDPNAQNFKDSWADGILIHHLTNNVGATIYDGAKLIEVEGATPEERITNAMAVAEEKLNIPQLITPKDMFGDVRDEHSIMVYLAQFQNAKKPEPKPEPISADGGDAAEVMRLDAERKEQEAAASKKKESKKAANYVPPAERKEDWRKYEGLNLGGRCKIRVFFSTTTSDPVIRKNTLALQELLEEMEVHLRPDFEPWTPVDIDMEKPFRDTIFEKAGTRKTPMLFIDDEFVGGYDTVIEMKESGELDKILAY